MSYFGAENSLSENKGARGEAMIRRLCTLKIAEQNMQNIMTALGSVIEQSNQDRPPVMASDLPNVRENPVSQPPINIEQFRAPVTTMLEPEESADSTNVIPESDQPNADFLAKARAAVTMAHNDGEQIQ